MAIGTPSGAGALGIVRVSGPDALAIAATLTTNPPALHAQRSHTIRRVALIDPVDGAPLDDAMCAVMRAPRSSTGEDVVELSCHGSAPLLRAVVERLCRAGARLAEPGEFTRRAFVHGRIDLARAEAVALMIGARTERAALLAARALAGDLGTKISGVRAEVVDVIAGLEVSLDFPDDDIGVDPGATRARITALADAVEQLAGAARRGRLVHDGVTIALIGRPNAGKSSLLNALLGFERAIVAATPGTTRDVVEGALVVEGVAVRLLDTAGLGTPDDEIEAEGMKRTRRAIAESDLVVLVQDGSAPAHDESDVTKELAGCRAIVVQSKSDLARPRRGANELQVSSLTGDGLPALLAAIAREIRAIVGDDHEEGVLAASVRQISALDDIASAFRSAARALDAQPLEVALVDLREALRACSGVLGVEVGDAVLDRIFASFCVGK